MSLSASVENLSSHSENQNTNDGGNMCLELALEGERLCKAGDCRSGVAFFQAAIQAGTDDLRTLSAIYSQLGNAYFYLGDYNKAMQYHKHDLTLARTMGDVLGEAKSSGNLGNTLKVMGKFDEAMICCKRHLEISRELNDKLSEGRALYNLGNVYHAKGKHIGRVGQQDPGEFPEEVKECLQQAVRYYKENLALMQELNDTAAQGRACGNLGNTYYLLGDFQQAIKYHQERLRIAREFGDKAAERRANSNLGNSHIFLGEFESAAEHYKCTLILAQELGDRAVEAQACYSLGNTYTLLRDYPTAIEYHLRHLIIAQQLLDRVGEGRACWSLGNAHSAMGNHDKALYFASKHLEISKELGDLMGQATAQVNVSDLRKIIGLPANDISSDCQAVSIPDKQYRVRRQSMEQLNLIKLTPDGKQKPRISEGDPTPSSTSDTSKREHLDDEESFFDLLSRFQSERMDDQRCSLSTADKENRTKNAELKQKGCSVRNTNPLVTLPTNVEAQDDLLDMIAGMQSKRMDEQRVALPHLPGLCPPSVATQNPVIQRLSLADANNTMPDEAFLEMLMRCQSSRLEDQRSSLPDDSEEQRKAPTVPDEDFFSLILRLQSGRMEDQRASVPPPDSSKNGILPSMPQKVLCLRRLDDFVQSDDNGFLSTPKEAHLISAAEFEDKANSQMPGPGAQLGSFYPPSEGVEGGGMVLGEQTQFRNPLVCCLCDDYYTDPCLMQCYHTFCSKCLRGRDTEGHISCPLCGTITLLKDNASLPPTDTLMQQLIDLVNAENPPCSNCDKRDKNSMFFCSTCGQALCNQCRENIHRAKMFSTHDIVHVSKCSKEVQKRCPVHGELYIMFNNAQKSMLCITCFRDTPNETRMHCIDLDAAYTQCSKKLDRAVITVCEVQNTVRDGLHMFKSLLEELRHNMDSEKHTINTFCQGMQESIAKTHSSMIMEVQRQYETKERSFRGQIVNLGTLLPVIQLHLLLCQSFTNIANKYQYLDLAYPMIDRLTAIGQLIQPQRPMQSSQIKTNYKTEFTQSLEPWIGKNNQTINHMIPTQDINNFDHTTTIPLPTQITHSAPSKRQQNALRTKAMEGEGPFSNHCRSFENQIKELSQQLLLVKERLGDLHKDVAIIRRAQIPPLMTRYQHITGDCTMLEEQIERHRVELERMKNVFEALWEEQICRIHIEQDIFQSQMNEILNLLTEVKHLCVIAQKLEPYIKSLTNAHSVQVSQHKTADQKPPENQQVQELNLHNQQLQSLLEHINSLQLDSTKFYAQSLVSPTGSKNLNYIKGDSKDKECRSRPRTPSQSPGTMAAMLDPGGNVILYETQRAQQSTPSDIAGEKRGVISQLFEKVRTKDDRKKSPEDRERSQIHRERSKSDGRCDIIRRKLSSENVNESSHRPPTGLVKNKGKKDQKYVRDGKVISIYQSISGRVLGSRSEHGPETNDMKQASRLPPPPPPARRVPSQDPSTDIRERLETHLKEKLHDMLNKSSVNKHISTRSDKFRSSLETETVEDLNYQRASDAHLLSPEDRKTPRAVIHRESQSRTGSTSTSPHRREEFSDQSRVRERSRERRDRREKSGDRGRGSRDRSSEEREKDRDRSKLPEGRERSRERRERRDKYGRCYPASDTEDNTFYTGHIRKKQNSCDSLTLSTVSVDSRKSSTDLGDRKTLVLVIGSGKGTKQKSVQKQRSWETFPPKRKSYDLDHYGRPHRDMTKFDFRPSSAQDHRHIMERQLNRDRDMTSTRRDPVEGTLRKADSFEGHEEAVRTLVAAVHQTRSQHQQQSRKTRSGGNISN